MNISDRVRIRNAGTLNLQLQGFLSCIVSQSPLGKGQLLGPGVLLWSRQMPEGFLEEKPALGAFSGGMANLQDQERDEKVLNPVHYKISHTLCSPPGSPARERGP